MFDGQISHLLPEKTPNPHCVSSESDDDIPFFIMNINFSQDHHGLVVKSLKKTSIQNHGGPMISMLISPMVFIR